MAKLRKTTAIEFETIEGEIWKPITNPKGYENYSISNRGRVLSPSKTHVIIPYIRVNGYSSITFNKPRITLLVHRLVGLHFIPNEDPYNKTQIDHIDRIRTNNNATNLRWVSPKENSNNVTFISVVNSKLDTEEIDYFDSFLYEKFEITGKDEPISRISLSGIWKLYQDYLTSNSYKNKPLSNQDVKERLTKIEGIKYDANSMKRDYQQKMSRCIVGLRIK
jgi:hypothetical protein